MKKIRVTVQLPDRKKANACYNYLKDKPVEIIAVRPKKLELVLEVEV